MSNSRLHLVLKERKQWVVLVFHETRRDTSECSLKGVLLDLVLGGGILDGVLYLLERADGDLSEVVAQVLLLEVLDHLEHVANSAMEVLLHV